jgi:hypothetical protein
MNEGSRVGASLPSRGGQQTRNRQGRDAAFDGRRMATIPVSLTDPNEVPQSLILRGGWTGETSDLNRLGSPGSIAIGAENAVKSRMDSVNDRHPLDIPR